MKWRGKEFEECLMNCNNIELKFSKQGNDIKLTYRYSMQKYVMRRSRLDVCVEAFVPQCYHNQR